MDSHDHPPPSSLKVDNHNNESIEWLYNQILNEISLQFDKGISILQIQENIYNYTGYSIQAKPYLIPYLYSRLFQDNRIKVTEKDKKTLIPSINDITGTYIYFKLYSLRQFLYV